MQYEEQQRRVARLSNLAQQSRVRALDYRHAMGDWKRDRFGRLEVYVWLFGAGALLGAIRSRRKTRSEDRNENAADDTQSRRSLFGLANLGIIAWRYLLSPVSPLSALSPGNNGNNSTGDTPTGSETTDLV
jgi:peptidoglycan/LPS O-acetylase OafA/YrhL